MSLLDRWQRASPLLKGLTVFFGTVAAGFGAITATATAWPYVEPYLVAHRGYVLDKVGGVQTTVNEVLLWKAEDTKNKIKADIGGWNIQKQKETDPETRRMIEQRIEQLNGEQNQVDDRIRKLKGQ